MSGDKTRFRAGYPRRVAAAPASTQTAVAPARSAGDLPLVTTRERTSEDSLVRLDPVAVLLRELLQQIERALNDEPSSSLVSAASSPTSDGSCSTIFRT